MFVYFLLGCLFAMAQTLLFIKFKTAPKKKFIAAFALSFIGNALISLALAWGYASLLESEMQAIAMGFLIFGGCGAIFDIIAVRVFLAKKPLANNKETVQV